LDQTVICRFQLNIIVSFCRPKTLCAFRSGPPFIQSGDLDLISGLPLACDGQRVQTRTYLTEHQAGFTGSQRARTVLTTLGARTPPRDTHPLDGPCLREGALARAGVAGNKTTPPSIWGALMDITGSGPRQFCTVGRVPFPVRPWAHDDTTHLVAVSQMTLPPLRRRPPCGRRTRRVRQIWTRRK
jgi:hypothetical protein